MTRIDQFESVFRSADKPVFQYDPFVVDSVMVLSDLEGEAAEAFSALAGKYLGVSDGEAGPSIQLASAGDFSSIEQCLRLID